jgi:hypothetical protein
MLVYSASQSNLLDPQCSRATRPPAGPPIRRPRSGGQWLAYFRANAASPRPIPWEAGAAVTPAELDAIAASLRAWQLGETSEGNHLRAAAARYSRQIGDEDYPLAVDLFIREEQRHGALLGRFLDLAGVERVKADWGDSLFRGARYFITDMEVWTTPVVMVETLALIYYNAVRLATGSPVLSAICAQILSDEGPHLRFACERLASLYRYRSRFAFRLTMFAQRLLFLLIVLLVWVGHRKALRAGGYVWRRYWRAARDKMNASWRLMDPSRYCWPEASDGATSAANGGSVRPRRGRFRLLLQVDYRSARDSLT